MFFASNATNLVTGDTNGAFDLFVRDLAAGTTSLVSVNHAGTASGNSDSRAFASSPDGRYVLFDRCERLGC